MSESRQTTHRRLRTDLPIGLRRDACLPLSFGYATCRDCAQACPRGALEVGATEIRVHGACTGCGRCAAACATGALRLEGADIPTSLTNREAQVRVECAKAPRDAAASDAIRVPCLEGVAVSQWLALVHAADGRPVQAMDHGWCGHCNAGGTHLAHGSLDQARALLARMGLVPDRLLQRSSAPLPLARMPREIPLPRDEAAISRRAFFGQVVRAAATTASAAADAPPPKSGARPEVLAAPERQRRLEWAQAIAQRHGGVLPAHLFPTLAIGRDCANHSVCAAACPTHALRTYQEGDHAGIAFTAAACIECGACASACRSGALAFEERRAPTGDEPVKLTRHRLYECRECFGRTPHADGLCDECRRSVELEADAFASLFADAPLAARSGVERRSLNGNTMTDTRGGRV